MSGEAGGLGEIFEVKCPEQLFGATRKLVPERL